LILKVFINMILEPINDNRKTKIDIVLQENETVSHKVKEDHKKESSENNNQTNTESIVKGDQIIKRNKKNVRRQKKESNDKVKRKDIRQRRIHFIRSLKSQ